MSLSEFEVVLRPDPRLRRIVFWTGVMLLSLGLMLVASVQISPLWRVLIGSIWLADCLRELKNLHSGNKQLRELVLDSMGNVAAIDVQGDRHELTLLSGSMVLPGLAWLRLRFGNGRCHAELFTGRQLGPETWHRLRLLWNQARDAFGHPPGP